jgi:hypothetical protein
MLAMYLCHRGKKAVRFGARRAGQDSGASMTRETHPFQPDSIADVVSKLFDCDKTGG